MECSDGKLVTERSEGSVETLEKFISSTIQIRYNEGMIFASNEMITSNARVFYGTSKANGTAFDAQPMVAAIDVYTANTIISLVILSSDQ